MGGGPGNMQAMVRQAQKMQEDMQNAQAELEQRTYEATVGGGAVSAIKPEVIDPEDAEMLADLITAAVNEAIRKAAEDSEQEMAKITGGMNMPGLF